MIESKKSSALTSTCVALLLGCLSWIMLLIQAARYIRLSSLKQYELSLGPFHLGTLAKRATESGFTVSIQLSRGMLLYLVCWGICGYTWGYISRRPPKKA
jgi:hypothetical protein